MVAVNDLHVMPAVEGKQPYSENADYQDYHFDNHLKKKSGRANMECYPYQPQTSTLWHPFSYKCVPTHMQICTYSVHTHINEN